MIYGSQNVSTHNDSTCNPRSHLGGRLNTMTLENRLTLSLVSLSVFSPAYNLSMTQHNQQTRVKSFGMVFTCFELQNLRTTLLFCTLNSNCTELRAVPQTRQAVPHLCTLPPCGCHFPNWLPCRDLQNVYLSSALRTPSPSHVWWPPAHLSRLRGNSPSFKKLLMCLLSLRITHTPAISWAGIWGGSNIMTWW